MKKFFYFLTYILFPAFSIVFAQKSYSQCTTYMKISTGSSYSGGVDIGDLDISGNQITVEATFNRIYPQ